MKENKNPKSKSRIKKFSTTIVLLIISALALVIDIKYMVDKSTVAAAGETFTIVDNTCTINSSTDLINFSKAYQSDAPTYQNVNISIAITNGNLTDLQDFQSIGTADYPFSGNLIFASSFNGIIALDKPFFAYLSDSCKITDSDGNIKEINFSRTSENNSSLFAENVVNDAGDTETANWKIVISPYSENDADEAYDFGGVIGTIGKDADVNLTIKNNAVAADNYAGITNSGNAGLACQTMAENAELTVTIDGTNTGYSVTSASGNAGGLVGAMESGTTLNVNSLINSTGEIKSTGGYAGGVVGYAKDATVNFVNAVSVNATVNGSSGTGGVFGYYENTKADNTFDVSSYTTNCTLNGKNNGGIFGELKNSGNVTINSPDTGTFSSTASTNIYGGLIGTYSATETSNSLTIQNITVLPSLSSSASNYGGVIGKVAGKSYVKFDNVTVNATNSSNSSFGGLVSYADNSFIDVANNITISATGPFSFGGVVYNLNNGVLRLNGSTDLSQTNIKETNYIKESGQIVAKRGNQALVYAKSGWQLIRSSSSNQYYDDIGTWGEVLRFNDTDFTETAVLTEDTANHTITVKAANTTVSSLADFAVLALNIQLNGGSNMGTLCFADTTNKSSVLLSSTITLNKDIDLSGTGLTGLTRDNGTNNAFTGTFNGNNYKISLAVGEPYGYRGSISTPIDKTEYSNTADTAGNGVIYRHQFIGLFAKTGDNATFKDLTISGKIKVDDNITTSNNQGMSVGYLSGQHTGGIITTNNVTISKDSNEIYLTSNGSAYTGCGGFIGKVSYGTINIDGCTISPKIKTKEISDTNGPFRIGGAIGEISSTNQAVTVNVGGTTKIGAEITNYSSYNNNYTSTFTGGFIGYIADNGSANATRQININDLTIDGASVTAKRGVGLLGDNWNNVQVNIGENSTNGITVNNSKVTYNGTGDFAGLVNVATGYWKVYNIDINSIAVDGSNAKSFGMLVNKGVWQYDSNISKKALYLELENENAYKITSANLTGLNNSATFDELVADCRNFILGNNNYKDYTNSDITSNGNAVVSIRTSNDKVTMDGTNCNTYQNQTNFTTKVNPNTRYYYNLDTIRNKVNAGTALSDSEKLLLWSVKTYALSNIRYLFNGSGIESTIPSGTYDMAGYSYYPIDCPSGTEISSGANFKFYNSEIESSENGAGNSDSIVRSTIDTANKSQHYLMHCGLFRNVSGKLTVNGITMSGNVGNASDYCGALVCGTISTDSTTPVSVYVDGVTLNGIKVNGGDTAEYAPLLINIINKNTTLTLSDVKTPANGYADGAIAATSLIGDVGNSTDADNIKLTFSNIVLDGRKTAVSDSTADSALNSAYNTTRSIFTKATLLNKYQYQTGKNCSAVYNFKHEEDWGADGNTATHKVTYGTEISDSAEYTEIGQQKQYIDTEDYTDPTKSDAASVYNFSTEFLPYVATAYSTANNTHEIKVNHKSVEGLEKGCGTYNDPYIIETAKQLELVADILNEGSSLAAGGTVVNWHGDNYKSWCSSDHKSYKYDAEQSKFVADDSTTKTLTEMQTALSTAYYKIDNNGGITLPDSFIGLGKTVAFKGVIWGAGNTITNKSTNPLIYNSTGSVVKDLNVNVTADFLNSFKSVTANTTYETDGSNGKTPFYGGIFGIVNGGDNIIDNVSVTIDNAKNISPTGTNPGNVAVGGYVGVVRYGGVIFRNMSGATKPDFSQNTKFGAVKSGSVYLYLNPIIGSVIDGYAVTETSKYTPREENNPTMQNGTKNYSIADINKDSGKITFNGTTISVPDGQALFLMGCIAMSGAGSANTSTNQYPATYSYGNNQMVRFAEYNSIGTNDNSNSDFAKAKGDNYANTAVPYIINHYTNDTTSARKLTTGTFSIELTGCENYALPDSFRGIGSMRDKSDNLEMTLSGFNGNGKSIGFNTNFYIYRKDYDQYVFNANGEATSSLEVGIGLFNKLVMTSGEIKNLTLTGDVKVICYHSESSATRQENAQASMCAGLLAGISMNNNITIEDVRLQNAVVDTMSISGGLIGIIRNGNNKTFTANKVSADNLSVAGGLCAGGLVGYVNSFICNVDGKTDDEQNSEFLINSISANSTSGNWNNEYQGCGGIFGALQKSTVDINNMSIDKSTAEGSKGSITSKSNAAFTGGVIGCGCDRNNGRTINITDATVKNIDIKYDAKANTAYYGGVIGGTKKANGTKITLKNVNVIGDETNGNTILGRTEAGGLIGLNLGDMESDKCTVENYNIQTSVSSSSSIEGVGGFIGKAESDSNNQQNAVLKNCKISNCKVQTDYGNVMPAGMIVGRAQNKMQFYGYNILVNNVQLTKADGTSSMQNTDRVGNITGSIDSNSAVKLVGLCKQNNSNVTTVGDFGTNLGTTYVIYSDFEGKCLEGTPNSTVSTINNANNVSDMGNSPFATVNPSMPIIIDSSDTVLTGDGISLTAISGIIADSTNYTNVATDRTTFADYTAKLSTFNEKTGANLANDFPVLVVNESNYQNVTKMINSYIHLLTNDTSITNYANDNSGKCNVVIAPYRFDGTSFDTKNEYSATLKIQNGYFRMTDSDYDSSHQQFTLIDIQYLAPNDTSKIAYHLYLPVYVEKMLKFNFTVGALSGTTYNTRFYKDGEPVLESYGTPVTAHITYSYLRTAQEWQDAINGGENVLKGYGKYVVLQSNNDLPDATKLILVDKNNHDKAYYSTISAAFNPADKKLDFDKFTASDGATAFAPVSFIDLLSKSADITANADTNGTLVRCSESDKALATVKIGDDYYRKKTDTDTTDLYSITVTPKANMVDSNTKILNVDEEYYIGFFTEKDSTAPMRNITISCNLRLGDDGMTPSRMNNVNKNESMVHMILGNLYDQEFSFKTTGDEIINENNNAIKAEMKTTIKLKSETAGEVKSYLNSNSIHLYHGFVIEAARTDDSGTEKGVKGSPQISGTYKIGDTVYNVNFINSDSVIKIIANTDGVDIKQPLISNSDGVIITCEDLQITYSDDAAIIEQFPERKAQSDTYGVTFSANSNLAYVPDNIEQSNISNTATDSKIYYRDSIESASLNYNIPYNLTDELIKLGINGLELNDIIPAIGYFNVLNIPEDELKKAEKVKFTLSLYQKTDADTYTSVNINDYLEDITLYGANGSPNSGTQNNNLRDFTFDRNELTYEAGSFEVKSTYSVITSEDFENASKTYANYKVQLTAVLLDASGKAIASTECSDYIIYTNAKIFTEMIIN